MKHRLQLAVATLGVVLLAACSKSTPDAPPAMPEANDENCKTENIQKLPESIRTKFADACFRRGSFKPSTGKTW